MKRKEIKSLSLNKRSISHFKQEEIKGGVTPLTPWIVTKTIEAASKLVCD